MKDLVFITGNPHKVIYMQKWLGQPIDHQKVDLDEVQSPDLKTVVEHKARRAYEIVKHPVLVEDVALYFTALGRLPGTFIKWFEEPGMEALCRMLDGFADRSIEGHIMYCIFDGESCRYFEGRMKGVLAEHPRGTGGFGFDAIFIADGYAITRAEMDETTYADTSYRKQAVEKLKAYLTKNA